MLDPEVLIQLDELVAVTTDLPGGRQVTHYGIVTELRSRFEGADLPSDTGRVVDRTLPAEHVRRAEVRVLRVVPELFVAPHAGALATRAIGEHRAVALFEDEMTRGKLPVGLDLSGTPVYADMRFVDGRSGGHVSISGISGVATKTSYALFLLYQLLETEQGMDLLGGRSGRESVRALVFNTKGEDLLHVDRPNAEFAARPDEIDKWRALGIDDPGPFRSVRLYAPRRSGVLTNVADVKTRKTADVNAYGWTPEQFIREQLLQFCFTSDDERSTQVGFVEQQVRIQLLRRLRRLEGDLSGAVVISEFVPPNTGFNPDRLAEREPDASAAGAGHVMRDFGVAADFNNDEQIDFAVFDAGVFIVEESVGYGNPPQLWLSDNDGVLRFSETLADAVRAEHALRPPTGKGLSAPADLYIKTAAAGDIDNDGDLDLWVESTGGKVLSNPEMSLKRGT